MIDANTATYDVLNSEKRLDNTARRIGHPAGRAYYDPETARQVREDKGIYVPDPLPAEPDSANPNARFATADHAKQLLNAERLLDEASNLVGLMLAALDDESASRAMQTEAGLKVIEKKLSKAHTRIDRYRRRADK